MAWHEAVDIMAPHMVRLQTPRGSGSGFLISVSNTGMCAIATAAHVVNHEHYWELPIRIQHPRSNTWKVVRSDERAIVIEESKDTAVILLQSDGLQLPGETMPLIEEGMVMKVATQIGWLGYPAIGMSELCFFSGNVSAWLETDDAYFVDGVAINGVSGGPAFAPGFDKPEIVGVVSAYVPNRTTGETLPGLAIVRNVSQFYEVTQRIKNLDEAKAIETPASDSPPPPTPEDASALQKRGS